MPLDRQDVFGCEHYIEVEDGDIQRTYPAVPNLVDDRYVPSSEVRWWQEKLFTLAEACWFVPIKQHDRTDEEQERVEEWTRAVVEARSRLAGAGFAVSPAEDGS